jgi:hypothetical protein
LVGFFQDFGDELYVGDGDIVIDAVKRARRTA